jgi:hypothetical protein
MPRTFDDVAECVGSTLVRVGPHIVLALPWGLASRTRLPTNFIAGRGTI